MKNPLAYIDAYFDGTLSKAQGAKLSAWLKADPENARIFARQAFIEQRTHDITLGEFVSEQLVAEACGLGDDEFSRTVVLHQHARTHRLSRRRVGMWLSSSLALMLFGVLFAWGDFGAWSEVRQEFYDRDVAILADVNDVEWLLPQMKFSVGERLGPDVLRMKSGEVRLDYSSGVVLSVRGPAEFDVMTATRTLLREGQVTVKSPRRAVGFKVHTQMADVIDVVGSQFGVEVGPKGETMVVVFDGALNIWHLDMENPAEPPGQVRLSSGEAVSIDQTGHVSRIDSVSIGLDEFRWSTQVDQSASVIKSVTDNFTSVERPKYYRIVSSKFGEYAPAYVDRFAEWKAISEAGMPDELVGADYVMPFHAEQFGADSSIELSLTSPAHLYIFFDDSSPTPAWLSDEFRDTGWDIGLDLLFNTRGTSLDRVFSVWTKNIDSPGSVLLGMPADEYDDQTPMFGVAAARLDSSAQEGGQTGR